MSACLDARIRGESLFRFMRNSYVKFLLVAGIVFSWHSAHSGTVDRSRLSITAQALYSEYDRNELAADQKYKGREINVGGIVEKIAKDKDGTPYVILRCSHTHTSSDAHPVEIVMSGNGVRCVFDERQAPRLIKLQPGQTFSVYGKVVGKKNRDVIVENCRF